MAKRDVEGEGVVRERYLAMPKATGFTVMELLIWVALAMLILPIALIPLNVLLTYLNETATRAELNRVIESQELHKVSYGSYATLAELRRKGLLHQTDPRGYELELISASKEMWQIMALPVESENRSSVVFVVSPAGVERMTLNSYRYMIERAATIRETTTVPKSHKNNKELSSTSKRPVTTAQPGDHLNTVSYKEDENSTSGSSGNDPSSTTPQTKSDLSLSDIEKVTLVVSYVVLYAASVFFIRAFGLGSFGSQFGDINVPKLENIKISVFRICVQVLLFLTTIAPICLFLRSYAEQIFLQQFRCTDNPAIACAAAACILSFTTSFIALCVRLFLERSGKVPPPRQPTDWDY